jgi:hypothetical protein
MDANVGGLADTVGYDLLDDLEPPHNPGVYGFKCILLDSGVVEFRHWTPPRSRQ